MVERKSIECKCGKVEKLPMYVYAHWTESITYTCPDCKRRYDICRGKARFIEASEPKKRKAVSAK